MSDFLPVQDFVVVIIFCKSLPFCQQILYGVCVVDEDAVLGVLGKQGWAEHETQQSLFCGTFSEMQGLLGRKMVVLRVKRFCGSLTRRFGAEWGSNLEKSVDVCIWWF